MDLCFCFLFAGLVLGGLGIAGPTGAHLTCNSPWSVASFCILFGFGLSTMVENRKDNTCCSCLCGTCFHWPDCCCCCCCIVVLFVLVVVLVIWGGGCCLLLLASCFCFVVDWCLACCS